MDFTAGEIKTALQNTVPELMGKVSPLKTDMYTKLAADAANGRAAQDAVVGVQSTPTGRGPGGISM
jgi:hypothetical protein